MEYETKAEFYDKPLKEEVCPDWINRVAQLRLGTSDFSQGYHTPVPFKATVGMFVLFAQSYMAWHTANNKEENKSDVAIADAVDIMEGVFSSFIKQRLTDRQCDALNDVQVFIQKHRAAQKSQDDYKLNSGRIKKYPIVATVKKDED